MVAKTFVLATGGIENPRLLLASNSRLPEGIGNQNDLVGRYFLEHPRFDAGVLLPFDSAVSNTLFYNDHNVSGDRIEGYLASRGSSSSSEELGEVQIRVEPVYAASLERALESEDAEAVRELDNAIADRDIAEIGANLKAVASDLMTWQNFVIAGAPVPVPYPEVVGEVLDASAGELEARLPDFLGDAAAVVYRSVAPAALVESVRLVSRHRADPEQGQQGEADERARLPRGTPGRARLAADVLRQAQRPAHARDPGRGSGSSRSRACQGAPRGGATTALGPRT